MTDEPSVTDKPLRLFFIGPLNAGTDEGLVFRTEIAWFVRDLALALGYEAVTPDFVSGGSWSTDLTHAIHSSDVVVADITAVSPSLLFELGVAMAKSKRVLLLTQSPSHVPFDLRTREIVSIDDGVQNARLSLARALTTLVSSRTPVTGVLAHEVSPSSPPVAPISSTIKVDPSINITIYSGTVFQGPITVSDQAIFAGGDVPTRIDFVQGDRVGLLKALAATGLDERSVRELNEAIEADAQDSDHLDEGPGPRVQRWWVRMTLGTGDLVGKVALGASGGLVAKLVETYFGMH